MKRKDGITTIKKGIGAGERTIDPDVINLPAVIRCAPMFSLYEIACVQKKALYDAKSAPGEAD